MVRYLNPSEAARRLGVSAKALRLYEQAKLLKPLRTEASWRAYGPAEIAKAEEIVALRGLGLSLVQVSRVLGGDAATLEPALTAHQAGLEAQATAIGETIARVRALRAELAAGGAPDLSALARPPAVTLDLPWPWGGERFELPSLGALTWLVGPLGSGKTRLAWALAEAIPGARFVGLDRAPPASSTPTTQTALDWLAGEGATRSDALIALMADLAGAEAPLVVDLVEQSLDEPTQTALASWLRARPPASPPLILMTRSTAMLDLEEAGAEEAAIYCPANHSPPMIVRPVPGTAGYEALASCLATPEARARTEGMRAVIAA